MAMVKGAYQSYLNGKKKPEEVKQNPVAATVQAQAPAQTPAPQVDPAAIARREMMLKFKAIIDADKAKMAEMDDDQKPLSRAYNSISSFQKDKAMSKEEEKISKNEGYHADRTKKLEGMGAQNEVRNVIRKNLITGGGFPQARVEELIAKVPEIPKELVEAYLNLQKKAIKYRLEEDDDYQHAKTTSQKDQFENLMKL